MIAIQTKYLPATNTKGARIKAFTDNGHSAIVPFPYDISGAKHEVAYFQAVKALIEKYGFSWDTKNMRYGGTNKGYIFCFDASIVKE